LALLVKCSATHPKILISAVWLSCTYYLLLYISVSIPPGKFSVTTCDHTSYQVGYDHLQMPSRSATVLCNLHVYHLFFRRRQVTAVVSR